MPQHPTRVPHCSVRPQRDQNDSHFHLSWRQCSIDEYSVLFGMTHRSLAGRCASDAPENTTIRVPFCFSISVFSRSSVVVISLLPTSITGGMVPCTYRPRQSLVPRFPDATSLFSSSLLTAPSSSLLNAIICGPTNTFLGMAPLCPGHGSRVPSLPHLQRARRLSPPLYHSHYPSRL